MPGSAPCSWSRTPDTAWPPMTDSPRRERWTGWPTAAPTWLSPITTGPNWARSCGTRWPARPGGWGSWATRSTRRRTSRRWPRSASRPGTREMAPQQTGRSRPPVMADVARLAGVSHQTVSRVLNDHPNVRPQTRDNVLAAIAELGYRPNAAARTLVTRRTRTLGVVSFDTTLYGPASMLYGIERAAAHSYFVSVASLPPLARRSVLAAVDRLLPPPPPALTALPPP